MKNFKLIATLFILTFNANASTESHRQAANQLLTTINLNSQLDDRIEETLKLALSTNPNIKPYEAVMRRFFSKYMSGDSLLNEYIEIYVSSFSEKEIIEINDFYQTDAGMKALKHTPVLLAQGTAIGKKRVHDNLPELTIMVNDEIKRLNK